MSSRRNYRSKDGQIEFDLIGKKNNVWHVFEIKWRNKPTNYRDLKNFLGKIRRSEFSEKKKKLFFVSKSGFTDSARKFAEKNEIELIENL